MTKQNFVQCWILIFNLVQISWIKIKVVMPEIHTVTWLSLPFNLIWLVFLALLCSVTMFITKQNVISWPGSFSGNFNYTRKGSRQHQPKSKCHKKSSQRSIAGKKEPHGTATCTAFLWSVKNFILSTSKVKHFSIFILANYELQRGDAPIC